MRKFLAMILALAMVLCLFAGCSNDGSTPADDTSTPADDTAAPSDGGETYKIGVVCKTLSSSWGAKLKQGFEKAGDELGVEVSTYAPDKETDVNRQVQFIEDLITQGVDGIVLCPCDSAAMVSSVKKCNDAGIPVSIYDTPMDEAEMEKQGATTLTYVGSNNIELGATAAENVNRLLPDGGKVAIVAGVAGQSTSILRVQGFREALNDNIEVVAEQPADWDANKGYDVAANILQATPDLDVFFVCSDLMGVGIAQMLVNEKNDHIKICGIDGQAEAIQSIIDGVYDSTVAQDPVSMAFESVKALVDHLDGKDVEEVINTPVPNITIDNAEEMLADA